MQITHLASLRAVERRRCSNISADDETKFDCLGHNLPSRLSYLVRTGPLLMRYVSLLGDWPLHALIGLALLGVAWRRGSEQWTRIFLAMLLAMILAGVADTVIKRTVPRARPSVHAETRWGGPHFSSKYHSFPSGHVAASTAFFGVLLIARRRVGLLCLPIPILIGFSRMYLGAHYVSDVVCAAVLGIFCALVVAHFLLLPITNHQSKLET